LVSVLAPHFLYQAELARRTVAFKRAELQCRQYEQERLELTRQSNSQVAQLHEQIGAKQLTLEILGPAELTKGERASYHVRAALGNGPPVPTEGVVKLRDNRSGQILFETKGNIAKEGWDFSLPAELPLQPKTAVHLEVAARNLDETELLGADLHVRGSRYLTHLAINQRLYRPGETVFFRSLTLGSHDLAVPEQPLAIDYDLLVGGKKKPVLQAMTGEGGIAGGEFAIPSTFEDGEYTLVASQPEKAFFPVKRRFIVRGGKPSASPAKPSPTTTSRVVEIEFFPEGGDFIAGALNRVYFSARDDQGKSVDFSGRLLDRQGRQVASLSTRQAGDLPGSMRGLGVFSFTPLASEQYRVENHDSTGTRVNAQLPKAKESGIAMRVQNPVAKEGEPLSIDLQQSAGAQRRVTLAAYQRGVLADYREVVLGGKEIQCTLPLPKGYAGATRVALLEPQGQGFKAVAERLVYRMPDKRLSISIKPTKNSARPGDDIQFKVTSQDEQGRPKPSWLLASILEQSFLSRAGDAAEQSPPALFYLTSDVDESEELDGVDFIVGAEPRAATVLDFFLGTYGWRQSGGLRSAELGSALVLKDNRRDISRKVRAEEDRALALLNQSHASQDKLLIEKSDHCLSQMKGASQALAAFQASAPSFIGQGSLLVALFVLVVCLVYGVLSRLRHAGIPRTALAGALAGLLIAIVNLHWFAIPVDAGNSQERDQQIALLEERARVAGKLDLPLRSSPIAIASASSITQPVRKTRSYPVHLPDVPLVAKEAQSTPSQILPSAELKGLPLREFSHRQADGKFEIPVVSQTIYWNPLLRAPDGHAQFALTLPSMTGSDRVRIDGHTADGRLGSAEIRLEAKPIP
jgi:hypothetical protein